MAALTWLHLSDLHACRPRSGWDAGQVTKKLVQDLAGLQRDHGLRPDLIFFTGDAAFGHLGSEPGKSIEEQFREAGAFLDAIRGAFSRQSHRSRSFPPPKDPHPLAPLPPALPAPRERGNPQPSLFQAFGAGAPSPGRA